jgi:hypothetical protein
VETLTWAVEKFQGFNSMKRLCLAPLFLFAIMIGGCQQKSGNKTYEQASFKQYWYSGKAELSSYRLTQSRYGEPREGKAVLIFVTEDFSKRKQVKLNDQSGHANGRVSVLKLNFTKNFTTGIYPYSMMTSVFTPVDREENPNTLKTSMSVQEWCGHVFTQLNVRGDEFNVNSYSYFEQEGDANFSLRRTLLEDEIWNIIRLEPTALPTGNIELIPSLTFTRLSHLPLKVERANGSLNQTGDNWSYRLSIPGQSRTLVIQFEQKFPHKILGWKEQFMEREVMQENTATLDKTLITDYWTKNKNQFQYLRDSLNLSPTH